MPFASIILISIVMFLPLLVYADMTRNKIGKIEGEKGVNLHPWQWAFLVLIASRIHWILTFPVIIFYLVKRPVLLKKAQTNSVETPHQMLWLGLFFLLGAIDVALVLGNHWAYARIMAKAQDAGHICEEKLANNAKENKADVATYIAQNQEWLRECEQHLKDDATRYVHTR